MPDALAYDAERQRLPVDLEPQAAVRLERLCLDVPALRVTLQAQLQGP